MVTALLGLIPAALRPWLAAAGASLAFAGGVLAGTRLADARIERLQHQQAQTTAAQAEVAAENARLAARWRAQVLGAQHARENRAAAILVAAGSTQRELDSLRHEIARLRAMPTTAPDAQDPAAAHRSGDALEDCAATAADLARALDGREDELRTVSEAWPR